MSEISLQVENLSKIYRLGEIGAGSFKNDIKRFWTKINGSEDSFLKMGIENDRTKKSNSEWVWALKDINFSVNHGEILGIIGRNGAGKSTLLKILSQITAPTSGRIILNGKIASLLEVGTGFHPELTGRDNIYLNGSILGMKQSEIKDKFDEIVDFSGIEKYLDTPVKRYSSGMYVRLAFAVAAHLEPDILIVDEVLAVGDFEFQKKCIGKIRDVSNNSGRTVIFVSHNISVVKSLCNRALLLTNGRLEACGKTDDIIEKYSENIFQNYNLFKNNQLSKSHLENIFLSNRNNNPIDLFECSDDIILNLHFKKSILDIIEDLNVDLFVFITNSSGIKIASFEVVFDRKLVFKLIIQSNQFVKGKYFINLLVNIPQRGALCEYFDIIHFEVYDSTSWMVKHGNYDCGFLFLNHNWIVN
jgi:lipopolysaccharide transport system ATP-binding protein